MLKLLIPTVLIIAVIAIAALLIAYQYARYWLLFIVKWILIGIYAPFALIADLVGYAAERIAQYMETIIK